MSAFDFEIEKPKKIKISIYGETYELDKPRVKQTEEFQRLIEDAGEKNELSMMKSFLEKLGLPNEASDEMQMDHFKKLVEFITGAINEKK